MRSAAAICPTHSLASGSSRVEQRLTPTLVDTRCAGRPLDAIREQLAAEDTDADSAALMGLPPLPPAAGLAPLGRARRDSRLSTLGFGLGYAVLEARDAQYHRAAAGASRDTGRSRAVSHQPVSMQHEADNACGRNRRGSM